MAPTILVVGATGNTGKSVIDTLPTLLESKSSNYRILGLTRSLDNPVSQKLASLPNIEMQEKDWTLIDADWLIEQEVVRVFIAPHNFPHQFVDESEFYIALLKAKVQYVVKVSTAAQWVGPVSPVFYGRAHWAIEKLLSQPEFQDLQWTSLQPSIFGASVFSDTVDWIKNYRKTGKQDTLKIILKADVPAALIDPTDVGDAAASLLALDDPTPHNQARYVLNGPKDVTGKDIVELVEQIIGTKVQDVKYNDIGNLDLDGYPKKAVTSILAGFENVWDGKFALSEKPTSKEIIDLAPPKRTITDNMNSMLDG